MELMDNEIVYEDWSFRGVTIKNVPKIRFENCEFIIKGSVMYNLVKLVDEAKRNHETIVEYRVV